MSESTLKARLVRIRYEKGTSGLIYASSPDINGLIVGRPSIEELAQAIPQAIRDMYHACGVSVVVTMLQSDDDSDEESWVAVPAEIAKAALAQEMNVKS